MEEPAGNAEADAPDDESADDTPGPMEHVEGMAPEIVTHEEHNTADPDDLSPEEAAIHGPDGEPMTREGDNASREDVDGETDEAALAEGRAVPPSP